MSNTNNNMIQSPISEYLIKLQLIVSNSEFKSKSEALKYETAESKMNGEDYVRAVLKQDTFESYQFDSRRVYDMLASYGMEDQQIVFLLANPHMIPQKYKTELLEEGRKQRIEGYVETNKYYVSLTGVPFKGNAEIDPDPTLIIPDAFYDLYATDGALYRDQPVHDMPAKYQELFMNTDYYKDMVKNNPDVMYIRYIGSNSIPLEVSRPAKDGAILKINENKLSMYHETFGNVSVSSSILHKFINIYNETRDYVYNTLRGDFGQIYPNYDSFIRFLTIYFAIGNTMNEFIRDSSSYVNMNNITAHNLFMLYGLPSVIMEGSAMIDFLKQFRLILMDKGTNIVYRVKDLIGYKYTDIYTLVMVKQQKFENGIPVFTEVNGERVPVQDIFFRRLGTTDENVSYFKFRDSSERYTLEEITSGDPRWWDSKEVTEMINNMNYTLSNSKYIQLSTHLSMTDIWWQCVILLRALLDNKNEAKYTMINVNYNINSSASMSVFDAVLSLIILMNYRSKDEYGNSMNGSLYYPNGYYNGQLRCLDELFNGLHLANKYQSGVMYNDGDVVGETLDNLYVATTDYLSNTFTDDIANGYLIKYGGEWEEGSPNELMLGSPYKVASFNYNIKLENPKFYNHLSEMTYLEPETFIPLLDSIIERRESNLGVSIMTDVYNVYKFLESKLLSAYTIDEYRQVTDAYNKLFLVDPYRNWDEGNPDVTDDLVKDKYQLTEYEYASLKTIFNENVTEFIVEYNDKQYPISLFKVMNIPVYSIKINDEYPFRDSQFITVFNNKMKTYYSNTIMNSSISRNVKSHYREIIIDKVMYDSVNTEYGPKSFEALLMKDNVSLYEYIENLKQTGSDATIITVMRAIVNALEDYTNTGLTGLQYSALGVDEYVRIIKEVITYFKSYMVEFAKSEFTYIIDNKLDNGGNSNMLKLFDEITSGEVILIPHDSLSLFDVSNSQTENDPGDMGFKSLYDDVIMRVSAKYKDIKETGYEIWYDDNKKITKTPFDISDDDEIVVDLIPNEDSSSSYAYKIIINIDNVNVKYPPNYYGNVL